MFLSVCAQPTGASDAQRGVISGQHWQHVFVKKDGPQRRNPAIRVVTYSGVSPLRFQFLLESTRFPDLRGAICPKVIKSSGKLGKVKPGRRPGPITFLLTAAHMGALIWTMSEKVKMSF